MNNNRGQVIIFNLLMLLIVVVIFMAFVPIFQEVIQNARGSNGLNCVSTLSICADGDPEPCYNASVVSEGTSCMIMNIYLPYIIIVVLIMGVAGLMSSRNMFSSPMQQPQYAPQY